jgi:beta-lactamase regulating signal transducer with metallopeptidase domain
MSTALRLAWTQIWQIAAVALAVAIVVRLIGRRRPHLAYLLWLVVIAKSLTPPIWSSQAGVFSWAAIARSAPSTVELSPAIATPIPPSSAPLTAASTSSAASQPPASEADASRRFDWLTATNVLALVWIAGTVILAVLFVANWFRIVGRLRRTALPLESDWQEQFHECARQLGLSRNIRFVVTSAPLGPAVAGVFRPVIVLPRSVFANEPNALGPIVSHELAHVRRGDGLAALFQAFAQCVWWFHPCVRWANRQANRERERACDEEVLAIFRLEPAVYAQCLLDVLRMKQTPRPIVAFPGVRAVEVTKRRLEHIMQPDSSFHSRTPGWCWAIALVAALMALPGAGLAFDSEPTAPGVKREAGVIERVLDHLRAREKRITSLHVAWESKEQPRADFWIQGNAYRDEVAGRSNRGGWWRAFDGATTFVYEGRDRTADISAGDRGSQLAGPRLFPILLFARPFSKSGFDPSPEKWRVVGENAIINNRHCVKLKTSRKGSDETIWVDPERDDVIVGWELRLSRPRWSTLLTIDYRRDEKESWIPTRWTQTETWQKRTSTTEGTIVSCSVDEPIPNEIFAPAFPPETTVLDTRNLERYRISKTGEKVPIEKFDSPEALKIAKALEQPVDFTIEPQPMKDAFDFIAARYQIKIVIDPAVAHAGVDSSMEVEHKTVGIKLKDVITALLKQASKPLAYRVENGVLTILPAPAAK